MEKFVVIIFIILFIYWCYSNYKEKNELKNTLNGERYVFNKTIKRNEEEKQLYKKNVDEEYKKKVDVLDKEKRELERKLEEYNEDRKLLDLKISDIPVLSKYFVDKIEEIDTTIIDYLKNKSQPALTSADIVKHVKLEKQTLMERLKKAEYLNIYYQSLVPWLVKVDSEPLDMAYENKENIKLLDKVINAYKCKHSELEKVYKEKECILKNREGEINKEALEIKKQFEIEYKEIEKVKKEISNVKADLEKEKELLELKVKDIPVLAKYFADREEEHYDNIENWLIYKPRPALTSAEIVRELKYDKKIIVERLKTAEYLNLYYESLVPWLKEMEEEPLDVKNIDKAYLSKDSNNDAVTYWLTPTEYSSLSEQERNQLALDRYKQRQKSNAEIGRDFERYIGYLYEKNNFQVEYRGIIDGFEDRGRDLICTKNKQILVVQCKYWSKNKTIHENHINQLFGTTVKYYMEVNPDATFLDFYSALKNKVIVPVFITSTTLSETAKAFADTLGILVQENKKLGDYPMIKCNVNNNTQEKIYHLPFDQQYDRVKIDGKAEFYAMTVEEAEKAGFRRAKKWLGN